jgi:hypothetical protein
MQLVSTTPAPDDLAEAMRQFIIEQGESRTDETAQRYRQVADDLMVFLGAVDVRPWLGAQIAEHLSVQRRRLGSDAFLTSLGLTSLIRVLPAFVADPWLPPPGAQRRTHRAAARYLMTFLRRRAAAEGCLRREDFTVLDRAIGYANRSDSDRPPAGRSGTVRCSVTLDLVEHLVDRLLEDITDGRYETLDQAIAARLNPVKVTVWRDPDPDADRDYPYGW